MQYYNIQPYSTQSQGGNKSSSYPNFASSQSSNLSNFQTSTSREMLNQFSLMPHQQQHQFAHPSSSQQNTQGPPYHRHSLNNLMPFNSGQQQFMNRRNSSCGSDRVVNNSLLSPLGTHERNLSDSGLNSSVSVNPVALNVLATSDINSRLESLCRQMTEQAIN